MWREDLYNGAKHDKNIERGHDHQELVSGLVKLEVVGEWLSDCRPDQPANEWRVAETCWVTARSPKNNSPKDGRLYCAVQRSPGEKLEVYRCRRYIREGCALRAYAQCWCFKSARAAFRDVTHVTFLPTMYRSDLECTDNTLPRPPVG